MHQSLGWSRAAAAARAAATTRAAAAATGIAVVDLGVLGAVPPAMINGSIVRSASSVLWRVSRRRRGTGCVVPCAAAAALLLRRLVIWPTTVTVVNIENRIVTDDKVYTV